VDGIARRMTYAILIALSVTNVIWALGDWRFYDLITYLDAAQMWVDAGNPYTPTARAEDWMLYRYGPWFAALFVPLLSLPRVVVEVGYSAIVTAASCLAVVPMIRQYGLPAVPIALFLGTMLFGIGTGGNIQPVMVAILAWSLTTRWGPLGVAIAASMKLTPLLFVFVFAGQREWRKVAVTLVLTAILLGPILFFELPPQATMPGPSNSLLHIHPALWAVVALTTVALAAWQAYRVAPTRWLATCVAVVMASPRLIGYDMTMLLAATPNRSAAGERDPGVIADPASGPGRP
jgi:hypothetical protein